MFAYKDMDESAGPTEAECPAGILDLLGPTTHEYAIDWRRRCLANLSQRARPIVDGMKIKLPEPLGFSDGYRGDEFTVRLNKRCMHFVAPTGSRYRISRFRQRAWTVIPESKVHTPVFAPRG